MDYSKYVDYVEEHVGEISKCINEHFERSKEYVKAKLIKKIREYLTPIPMHYEWEPINNEPYDHSGTLIAKGVISLNQTVANFLESEYSGQKEASYESGRGWNYNTYSDELSYTTIEIAGDIMFSTIRQCIEEEFSVQLSDDDFDNIRFLCGEYDEIYDNCLATDFFSYESAIDFVGIGDMILKTLL